MSLSVNPTSVSLTNVVWSYSPHTGQMSATLTITSDGSWTVAASDPWVTVTPSSGTGNGTVVLGARNLGQYLVECDNATYRPKSTYANQPYQATVTVTPGVGSPVSVSVFLAVGYGDQLQEFATSNPTVAQQATPTFSPVGGNYVGTQNVTITSAGADAIYYTSDGSTPVPGSSTLYTGPVSVAVSETLKAIAVKFGLLPSLVGTATYVLNAQQPTPTFSPNSEVYSPSPSVSVTITSLNADAIYYTNDGSTPTTGSTFYTGPVTVSGNQTLKALAVRAGWLNSAIGMANYVGNPPVVGNVAYGSNSVGGSTVSTSATLDSTGHNFVIAAVSMFTTGGSGVTAGVTDSLGNTWHPLTLNTGLFATNYYQFFYTYGATTSVTHSVTATATSVGASGVEIVLAIAAFKGVESASDPFESGTDLGNTTPVSSGTVQPGSVIPAAVGDIIITSCTPFLGVATPSVDSGFTPVIFPVGPAPGTVLLAYLISPNGAAANPTWTFSPPASVYPAANIAAFRHA